MPTQYNTHTLVDLYDTVTNATLCHSVAIHWVSCELFFTSTFVCMCGEGGGMCVDDVLI